MATIDPVTQGFWVRGIKDTTYKNLKINGLFGLRYCENIVIDTGEVFGNKTGDCCVVGSQAGYGPSKNIQIKNIYFHDFTIDDPSDHSEALYISNADGVLIEGCKFERIYGNTADLFFTGWEIPGNARNVTVRNCHFLPPTNGSRTDGVQFNDTNGGFQNFLFENNLWDGAQLYLGTLKKPTTNFTVGVNYGTQPSDNTINYAKNLGVKFTELPFRPRAQWPGSSPTPPTIPPVTPPTDPCADVKLELSAVKSERDAALAATKALQAKIDRAVEILTA